jgi:hypothetical protein
MGEMPGRLIAVKPRLINTGRVAATGAAEIVRGASAV